MKHDDQLMALLDWQRTDDAAVLSAFVGSVEFSAKKNLDGSWAVSRHESSAVSLGDFHIALEIIDRSPAPAVVQDSERRRADLKVVGISGGSVWDHTGTRQSDLFRLIDLDSGVEFLFDSRADWRMDEVRRVSFEVFVASDGVKWIRDPRPVKKL